MIEREKIMERVEILLCTHFQRKILILGEAEFSISMSKFQLNQYDHWNRRFERGSKLINFTEQVPE